jgi:hypothetical protein
VLGALPVHAQSTTTLQPDATVLPRRTLSVRGLVGFTRFDALLGDGGKRNLAESLVTDSLGAAQLPELGVTESAVRTLLGNSGFSVKAGNVVAKADSRIATAPLILEYGLTNRLTIGVVVPFVKTRSTVFAQLNPRAWSANVGANPQGWVVNQSLVSSLRAAAASLESQLSACQADPSGAGCGTLLAQQSSAEALIASTTPFATALATLYGTSETSPGATFVPIAGTAAQLQINERLAALRASYASFSTPVVDGVPSAATAQAARTEMQALLSARGYDSLGSRERTSLGDVSIGATYQLFNTFGDSVRAALPGILYRASLNATARIGTGQPWQRNKLFDNSTGYGQPGMILGVAGDVRLTQRVFLTGVGSYTKQFGTIDVTRLPNAQNAAFPLTPPIPGTFSAGDELALTLIPRYRLGGFLSIDGIYSIKHIGADDYAPTLTGAVLDPNPAAGVPTTPYGNAAVTGQIVGIGFSYSSSLNERWPGRLPYEASFRHTETIAASGGPLAKTSLDQIQLRVFVK